MFTITELQRFENEDMMAWQIRCCLAKRRKETDMDWIEIRDMLGLDITPDQLRKQAVGYEEYDNYIHGFNSIATSILSISDLHIPFQLDYTLLEKYRNVDILQINGDVSDMQAISRFPKVYRMSPMEEIIETRKYLIELIEYINPKKVVITYGNHDSRFQTYLAKNLDSDLLELMPQTSLELIIIDGFRHFNKREKVKIEYKPLQEVFDNIEINYADSWYYQIGDCIFCHPTAYSSGILKTAEKAMLWFRNEGFDFKNLIMAHTHRSGQYTIGSTTIYEQGAFCDVKKNNYSDGKLFNSQKEGFIFVCQDNNGNTIKDKTKLVVLN